jgi:hypothetical protein
LILKRLLLMVQAAILDGQFLYPFPPFNDGGIAPEVGVGRRIWHRILSAVEELGDTIPTGAIH